LSQQLQAQAPDTGAPQKHWRTASNKPTSPTLRGALPHTTESVSRVVLFAVSANVSYQHAEEDVELFTGIQVAAKTQQRLVHRQTFEMPEVKQFVEELSVDGVRFASTPQGTLHLARIQGVRLHDLEAIRGIFPRQRCPDRVVNHQPLASPITCLGMGMTEFGTSSTKLLTVNVGKFSIGIT